MIVRCLGIAFALVCSGAWGAAPALPKGLGGLGTSPPAADSAVDETDSALSRDLTLAGFWEGRSGIRTQDDPNQNQATLGETRLQLRLEHADERVTARLTTDFLLDAVQDQDQHGLDQADGEGYVDLREASLAFRVIKQADIKAGRQILTWGTGDLIFVNDLFPKDWVSFLIGRDVEYLKAPSTSVKLALFSDFANLDLVYTPRFEPDRYIDGDRLSFFNPLENRLVGEDDNLHTDVPDQWWHDDEFALRLHRQLFGYQFAVYGYRGYWKSPAGFDLTNGDGIFPALSVVGASVEGPLAAGIGNLEIGYYDSRDDRDGDDPGIRNSELRVLAGYRQELARDLTLGLQYYLERMQDYGDYRDSLPPDNPSQDRSRHMLTTRLTRLELDQNLRLSLFVFYSPSDDDGYVRPSATFSVDDHWTLEGGANWFFGDEKHTFFGQFQDDTNLYAAIRYNFAQ
ncbi:MAG: hypothetical protein U5S82_15785 [Gammaproteobacteria bacterium]|nr:hypothetical protein [Gammaproteobacteria bacterium]